MLTDERVSLKSWIALVPGTWQLPVAHAFQVFESYIM